MHAQLAAFAAATLPEGAKLISLTSGELNGATTNPVISLVMPADGGEANRCLVFIFYSEAASLRTISLPSYGGNACTLHSQIGADGGTAGVMAIAYLAEANFPAAGAQNFAWTLNANNRGHVVAAYLLEDVDQVTPLGTVSQAGSVNQVPPFITAYTATALAGQFLLTGDAVSEGIGVYVANDIDDNIGNMTVDTEHTPRSSPGGTLRTAHVDAVPDASELYQWTNSYGASVDLDTTLRIWCPVNFL